MKAGISKGHIARDALLQRHESGRYSPIDHLLWLEEKPPMDHCVLRAVFLLLLLRPTVFPTTDHWLRLGALSHTDHFDVRINILLQYSVSRLLLTGNAAQKQTGRQPGCN